MRMQELETEVSESLVGFGHLVRVVLLADSVAFTVLGSNEFGSKAVGHVGFVAVTGGIEEPAESESLGAVRGNFHRNLVVGTTDAAGLDFDAGLDVLEANFKLLERSFLAFDLLVEFFESSVDDLFGDGLLALLKDNTDEFGNESRLVTRIREDGAMEGLSSSRHILPPYFFAGAAPFFLTPYLERAF